MTIAKKYLMKCDKFCQPFIHLSRVLFTLVHIVDLVGAKDTNNLLIFWTLLTLAHAKKPTL